MLLLLTLPAALVDHVRPTFDAKLVKANQGIDNRQKYVVEQALESGDIGASTGKK